MRISAIKTALLICLLGTGAVTTNFFCTAPPEEKKTDEPAAANKELSKEELIARGSYLVTGGGCNDCHSPKIMTPQGPIVDTTKILSGHPANSPLPPVDPKATQPGYWYLFAPDLTAIVGPWGISYTANLTPDSATGLGTWTADIFMKTIRTGKHLGQEGGRQILPPMPWAELAKLKDEDLTAIFTYLQSIPAISNKVPAPVPPTEAAKMK